MTSGFVKINGTSPSVPPCLCLYVPSTPPCEVNTSVITCVARPQSIPLSCMTKIALNPICEKSTLRLTKSSSSDVRLYRSHMAGCHATRSCRM